MVPLIIKRVVLVPNAEAHILVWTSAPLATLAELMRNGQIVYGESYRRLTHDRRATTTLQPMRYGDPAFRFGESIVRNRAVEIASDSDERLAMWRVTGFSADAPIEAGRLLHIDPAHCHIQLAYTGVEHTALVRLLEWTAQPETIPAAFRMRGKRYTAEQIQRLLPNVAEIAMPLVIDFERPHLVSVIPTPD